MASFTRSFCGQVTKKFFRSTLLLHSLFENMLVSVSRVSSLEVSLVLPHVCEDVGIYKKKFTKTGRSRPPSAQASGRSIVYPMKTDNLDTVEQARTLNVDPKTSDLIKSDLESQDMKHDSNEPVDLVAISKSVENSLANLVQVKSVPDKRNDFMKNLSRKLSFKKKVSADTVATIENSMESSSSKPSVQVSDKRPRLRPLKPIGMANGAIKAKMGEDVFLKSIFGSKSKNTNEASAQEDLNAERQSESNNPSDKRGANGARMRFVRNILVPVGPCNKKSNMTEKKIEIDTSTKSKDIEMSDKSSKKELSRILRNVENRNILINKKGQHQPQLSFSTNPSRSQQGAGANRSAGRSPVKIMKLIGPESTVPDSEKKVHYKLRASIESDYQSLNPMDSGLLLKKHDGVDFNKTMPNLKDALENELKQKDNKLTKTGTSICSDSDEVAMT